MCEEPPRRRLRFPFTDLSEETDAATGLSNDAAARRRRHRGGARPARVPDGSVLGAAEALHGSDAVDYAEPAVINRFVPHGVPTDALYGEQWHLHAGGGAGLAAKADAQVREAWELTKGSRSVVVAVL